MLSHVCPKLNHIISYSTILSLISQILISCLPVLVRMPLYIVLLISVLISPFCCCCHENIFPGSSCIFPTLDVCHLFYGTYCMQWVMLSCAVCHADPNGLSTLSALTTPNGQKTYVPIIYPFIHFLLFLVLGDSLWWCSLPSVNMLFTDLWTHYSARWIFWILSLLIYWVLRQIICIISNHLCPESVSEYVNTLAGSIICSTWPVISPALNFWDFFGSLFWSLLFTVLKLTQSNVSLWLHAEISLSGAKHRIKNWKFLWIPYSFLCSLSLFASAACSFKSWTLFISKNE